MKLVAFLTVAAMLALPVSGSEIAAGRFSAGDLTGWGNMDFNGKTVYTITQHDGRTALQAYSNHAASGLLKKVSFKPADYPIVRWSWNVERPLPREDVTRKSGDDFAARVYVIFPRGFFKWQNRALNYVWASRMPKGSFASSPYTSNSAVIAVESGNGKAGTWVTEERNIYEDYRKAFGSDPPPVGAVAVMTDTDNTGDEVTAWYGDITFVRSPQAALPPRP